MLLREVSHSPADLAYIAQHSRPVTITFPENLFKSFIISQLFKGRAQFGLEHHHKNNEREGEHAVD
ncbi:hypothetical protein SDC9_185253 [bioreactor metagenome]|uniref:Uncharacterized protein n=1 Tax=bioreactor metagenome TaxID=1076179 RepID=A0A645HH72_9ZZZZ